MLNYALIGLVAIAVLLIVNYDILFSSDGRQNIPALGTYKMMLYGLIVYYATDAMWGIFYDLKMINCLYWDTVLYFIIMAANVMLWTRYVVQYLAEERLFGRILSYIGQVFFGAVVIMIICNFFAPVFFWYDRSGEYYAGIGRDLQLFFQITLLLLTSVYALKDKYNVDKFTQKRYRAIFQFGLIVGILLIIQLAYPLLPLYSIGFMLGTCLIHTFVFKEELEKYRLVMLESMEKAEAQEKLSQAKGDFLSNVSHEVRTPINTFLGMNELILRECEDKNIISYAENAQTAGKTLLGLVNDILDYSIIEAGKIEIIPVEYDLSAMLKDLANMVYKLAADKGLELSLVFDSKIPKYLVGDVVRIKQVIRNILTNAVKYTDEGSIVFSVIFRTIEEDRILLIVSVNDTGVGIRPEDQDRLFDKFERIDRNHNRNVEGIGLGLPIAQRLLKMMGSLLHVESVYGAGSTFYFRLEQKVVKWEPLGDFKAPGNSSLNERKTYHEKFTAPEARILAVDDNTMNLVVFQKLLKKTQVQIDIANNGDEALLLAQNKEFDAIFLDYMMPDKNGIETLHELRENGEGPNAHTPAICLTAEAISGAREKFIEAGFNDYLAKPVDCGKLEDMLINYLPKEKVHMSQEAEADGAGI